METTSNGAKSPADCERKLGYEDAVRRAFLVVVITQKGIELHTSIEERLVGDFQEKRQRQPIAIGAGTKCRDSPKPHIPIRLFHFSHVSAGRVFGKGTTNASQMRG